MPKKTFETAPKPKQPSIEEIEAFEQGGAGHDGRKTTIRPAKGEAEPTKRLSLDLPVEVHRRFKTACSAKGRKMGVEIQQFVEQRTIELEAEAGITHK